MSDDSPSSRERRVTLTLYISRRSPASIRAVSNLHKTLETLPDVSAVVDVVDVADDPLRARTAGVYVTPTLHVRQPVDHLLIGALEDGSLLRSVLSRPAA